MSHKFQYFILIPHREMERTEGYKNKPIMEVLVSAQSNEGLFASFIREFIHETFIFKAVKTLYVHLCSLFVPLVPPLNCLQLRPLFLCAPYHVRVLVYHSISQKSQKSNFCQYNLSCHFCHPTQTHKRLISNTFTLNVKNDRKMKSKKLLYNT